MDQLLEALQEHVFLFTVLGCVIAIVSLVFTIYKASHERHDRFLNDRIRGLEDVANAERQQQERLKAECRQLEDEVSRLKTECKRLEEEANAERRRLKVESERQEDETNAERKRARLLKAKVDDLEAKVDEREVELGLSKSRLEARSRELAAEREKAAQATRRIDDLLARPTTTNGEELLWRKKRQELEAMQAAIQTQNSQLQQESQIKSQEADGLRKQLRASEITIQSLRDQLETKPIAPLGPIVSEELRRCWLRPVKSATLPRFRPDSDRKMRIVSLLNLKGGVGKTTLAANIAATLWRDGQNVLLIDLDFQGSLTARCFEVPPNNGAELFFKNAYSTAEPTGQLLKLVAPIRLEKWQNKLMPCKGNGYLVAAGEELADVETSLMVQWLFGHGADVRFLLHQALHHKSLDGKYNCVLIDCPPRLTTACVNAIACSDALLIPVVLDKTSTERVPLILHQLKELSLKEVCPELRKVAVVANMVGKRQREQDLWGSLPSTYANIWNEGSLNFVEAQVSDDSEMGVAADLHFPAVLRRTKDFNNLRIAFDKLTAELKGKGLVP